MDRTLKGGLTRSQVPLFVYACVAVRSIVLACTALHHLQPGILTKQIWHVCNLPIACTNTSQIMQRLHQT